MGTLGLQLVGRKHIDNLGLASEMECLVGVTLTLWGPR